MYSIFIGGLIDELQSKGIGIDVLGRLVHSLFFADDVVLLSESLDQLQIMVDTLAAYANKFRFVANVRKCGVLSVWAPGDTSLEKKRGEKDIKMNGQVVPKVTKYKYLGVYVSN